MGTAGREIAKAANGFSSISPWWPAGHYNSGLILGELENYRQGILSLQKYLQLEPDAPDARAVHLKIYQWESLVPQAEM